MNSEYIPSPKEANHKPVFRLAPVEDDLTTAILSVRLKVLEEKTLPFGARCLFVYLLDLSLRRNVNVKPGVVTVSHEALAHRLGVTRRTVFDWKANLEARQLVWCTQQFTPNTWPIDTWHLTAIDPPGVEVEKTTPDGIWANGKRRPALAQPGPGFRRSQLPAANFAESDTQVPDNALGSGNQLPASGEVFFSGEEKQTSPERRRNLLLPREENFPGEEKKSSPERRSKLPLTREANFPLKKTQVEGIESLRGGEAPPDQIRGGGIKGNHPPFRSTLRREIADVESKIATIRERGPRITRRVKEDTTLQIRDLEDALAVATDAKEKAKIKRAIELLRTNPPEREEPGKLAPGPAAELKRLKERRAELEKQLEVAI